MVNWSIYSPGGDLICPFPSVCHIVVKTDTDGDTTDVKIDTAGDTFPSYMFIENENIFT